MSIMTKHLSTVVSLLTIIGSVYLAMTQLVFAGDMESHEKIYSEKMLKMAKYMDRQNKRTDKLQSIVIQDMIDRAISNESRTPAQTERLKQLIELRG